VVGVVNDVRPRSIKPETQPVMQFYVPYEQVPPPPFPDVQTISALLLRTQGDPERSAAAVHHALRVAMPDLPYVDVKPYQSLIDPQMRPWQLGATMFTAFGGLALAMAAIGLYGLLAYAVAQRTKEMGVRLALGATAGDLIRLVMGEGLRVAALGILAGSAIALAAGRWLEPLLFGTEPWDPLVFASVAGCLFLVAALASLVPAWRATRTSPLIALRAD
jgi:ABC-type antimicrobial peptide transport system permease subunit